jgi:hypothetical protein
MRRAVAMAVAASEAAWADYKATLDAARAVGRR